MKLSEDDNRFLDDMSALMAPWGWPRPVGRLYGYLLLRAEPATLDEIAADLSMSKSNASVAARTLEHCGNARRQGEPGSRRIYYSIPDEFGGPFRDKAALLGRLTRMYEGQQARDLPEAVAGRFGALAEFHSVMREAIEAVLDKRRAQACSGTGAVSDAA